MGNQLVTFVGNHWPLCLAFVSILILMLLNERIAVKQGPQKLSTHALVDAINRKHAIMFDLRGAEAFRQSHIVGAQHVPNVTDTHFTKYKDKPIVLICERGLQSSQIAAKLRKQGFEQVMVLAGGIEAWKAANLPLTKTKKEAKKAQKNKQG